MRRPLPAFDPAASPPTPPSPPSPRPGESDGALSRRDFMSATAWSIVGAALASACGGGGGDPASPGAPAPTTGATFNGTTLTVPLSAVPDLALPNGFRVFTNTDAAGRSADILVINLGGDVYRAFTSICTHEACTVSQFANGRLHCPCHDSFYDTSGRNVSGPAPRPLQQYATAFDAGSRTLTVTKG